MYKHWEHFEHGADIGVRGVGASKAEAFEQAALALTAVITDPLCVDERETVHIRCGAADDELLLANWLNALVREMTARRMLFARFHVQLNGRRLEARALGEPISTPRHQPALAVKGVTYVALRVAPLHDGWLAQTVVDV